MMDKLSKCIFRLKMITWIIGKDKVSADIKKEFQSEPALNKKFL